MFTLCPARPCNSSYLLPPISLNDSHANLPLTHSGLSSFSYLNLLCLFVPRGHCTNHSFFLERFLPLLSNLMAFHPGCPGINISSSGITDTTRATARSVWFREGGEGLWIRPSESLGIYVKGSQEHKQGPVATCPLDFSESWCQVQRLESCWSGGPLPCPPGRTAKVAQGLHTQGDA